MPRLNDFDVLTFDCYGTLIDWESGIWDAMQPLLHSNARMDVSRRAGLELFARHESAQQAETPSLPYPQLMARVHRRIADELGLINCAELDEAFGESVHAWPAFPDSAEALRALGQHYKLVILSNVNRAGFAASNRKLGVTFDAIYTAEDIGSYKPSPANFDYLIEHLRTDLGIAPETVLHTAQSLFHDHVPARQAGLANCWIDRQRMSQSGDWGATRLVEGELPSFDFTFFTLAEMATAVAAEQA